MNSKSNELENFIHLIGDGWLTEAFDLAIKDPKGKGLVDLIERVEADIRKELAPILQQTALEARLDEVKLATQYVHPYELQDRIKELKAK